MFFKRIDFDGDKSAQYFAVRDEMAIIYCEDEGFFGPISASSLPLNFSESSEEKKIKMKNEFKAKKDLMTKGKNGITEKIK